MFGATGVGEGAVAAFVATGGGLTFTGAATWAGSAVGAVDEEGES